MNALSRVKNEEGGLAIDFIFAITITMASTAVFFAVCFSLSIIEVAQYIGFASARTYFAGHMDVSSQEDRAQEKFNSLVNKGLLKNLFKENGWFKLTFNSAGNFSDDYIQNRDFSRDILTGTRLEFEAEMLNLNFPLIGSTADDAFKSSINSYLGREVSFSECKVVIDARYEMLLGLGYNVGSGGGDAYHPLIDNGC